MRKIYFILLLIFTVNIALAGPIDENVVTLRYNNVINGLKVEVLWKPKTVRNGYARGPAIIQLTDEEHEVISTVVANYFTVTEERAAKFIEWKKEENEDAQVKKILSKTVNLDYINPKIPEGECRLGVTDVPFFFYDLNFDGKKELLVGEVETGQRWRTTFKAYELADSKYSVLKNPYLQITYNEPYIFLDEASMVNRPNKTITIFNSAGVGSSSSEIYKAQPAYEDAKTNKFVLKEIIEY